MKYVTIINDQQFEIEIDNQGNVTVNGHPHEVDFLQLGPSLYSIITEYQALQIVIEEEAGKKNVLVGGRLFEAQVLDERALLMAMRKGALGASSGEVQSPMPGLIVAVQVEEGASVDKGQTVVILESMKMQNELKSPIDGTVTSVQVSAGQTVDKGTVLVVIEAPDEEQE
jgi:biotin carboxyl carrier protein